MNSYSLMHATKRLAFVFVTISWRLASLPWRGMFDGDMVREEGRVALGSFPSMKILARSLSTGIVLVSKRRAENLCVPFVRHSFPCPRPAHQAPALTSKTNVFFAAPICARYASNSSSSSMSH